MKTLVWRILPTLMILLGGCAANQEITRLTMPGPQQVCIVRHEAVKEGVLEAIQQGFESHGIPTKVVSGVYEKKHAMWMPRFYIDQVKACDALCFYVANWNWDLASYMYFANIWMATSDGKRLAQATYDAGRVYGPNKFIIARTKILELMNDMLADFTTSPTMATPPTESSERLERLEELRKKGLISEEEYKTKRRDILDGL